VEMKQRQFFSSVQKPNDADQRVMTSTAASSTTNNAPETPRVPKLYEISDNKFTPRVPIRPFIEQKKTPVDRVLDYVMGESINNRYALICSNCRLHNGMALKEEFSHVSFICYKCSCYNPSRSEIKARHKHELYLNLNHNVDTEQNNSIITNILDHGSQLSDNIMEGKLQLSREGSQGPTDDDFERITETELDT